MPCESSKYFASDEDDFLVLGRFTCLFILTHSSATTGLTTTVSRLADYHINSCQLAQEIDGNAGVESPVQLF